MININRREEMADYQRHAMHAMGMNGGGGNGHAHAHTHSLAGWNGNTATTAAASRLPGNMPPVGGFNPGYSGRPRYVLFMFSACRCVFIFHVYTYV